MNTPMICSDGCEYPNEYSTSKADFNAWHKCYLLQQGWYGASHR
jgi:hypothetical protein